MEDPPCDRAVVGSTPVRESVLSPSLVSGCTYPNTLDSSSLKMITETEHGTMFRVHLLS